MAQYGKFLEIIKSFLYNSPTEVFMKKILFPLVLLLAVSCKSPTASSTPSVSESNSVESSNPPTSTPSIRESSSEESTSIPASENSSANSTTNNNLKTLSGTKTVGDYQLENFNQTAMPTIGNIPVLVIPVEILGSPFESNYKQRLELTFNGTSEDTGWESVSSYYNKSSFGKVNYNFEITNKYTTTKNKSAIQKSGEFGDSVAILDVQNQIGNEINFSQYDSNKDGYVDAVIYIFSVDYSDTDPWWAWVYHNAYNEENSIGTKNGKKFGYYGWMSYHFINDPLAGKKVAVNAETYIHEFGHILGWPDLYTKKATFSALGGWDMMDMNNGDNGPFQKIMWDWTDPVYNNVDSTYQVDLSSYSLYDNSLNKALIIPSPKSNILDGDLFDEFLLITYYQPVGLYNGHMGYDVSVNKQGIVIYHYDATLHNDPDVFDFFAKTNDATSKFFAEILEADKNNSIPGSKAISSSDLLTSGTLDLSTYKWNDNTAIGHTISVNSLNQNHATISVTNK